MSRRLRYQVAVSLDGFIAGPNGEYDWIVADPTIDFKALYAQFDTAVMGRKTYEVMTAQGGSGSIPGLEVIVFSRTLPASAQKGVRIVNDDPPKAIAALKKQSGGDIWLFGGGALCRSLLDAGLVDSVEVAVMPVMVTAGIPLVAPGRLRKLALVDHRVLPASGIVVLSYSVAGAANAAPSIGFIKERTPRAKKARPRRQGKKRGAR